MSKFQEWWKASDYSKRYSPVWDSECKSVARSAWSAAIDAAEEVMNEALAGEYNQGVVSRLLCLKEPE